MAPTKATMMKVRSPPMLISAATDLRFSRSSPISAPIRSAVAKLCTVSELSMCPRSGYFVSAGPTAFLRCRGYLLDEPSMRQRIWPHLNLEYFGISILAAFAMEICTGARCGPYSATFPTSLGVVNSAVGVLGKEAQGIRHTHAHKPAIDHGQQCFATIGRGNRHIGPQAQGVVAIHPNIVGMICAARFIKPLELRAGEFVQLPAFCALLAFGRRRPVQGPSAQ